MSDAPPPSDETPAQKALRLKKAAQGARTAVDGQLRPEKNKAMTAGASKPWMKK